MSYAMLHHNNKPRHALGQPKRSYSPPMVSNLVPEDGPAINGRGDLGKNFELKDLTGNHDGSRYLGSTFDREFEESHSDEEEKSQSFYRSHRASTSTLQSFILYTPDEERSVIRKFDRWLVLFVALLYMLSFLDRSSTFLRSRECFVLTSGQILEMRGLPVCRRIYISAHCNMNGYYVLSTSLTFFSNG